MNKNKLDRLTEHFCITSFIVMHLYDCCILYTFLFDNNMCSFIFQPDYFSSGLQVAKVYLSSSRHNVETNPGQDVISSQCTFKPTIYSPHSHGVAQCRHSLRCGKKSEYLKKKKHTHTDMGRTCKDHTDSGPCREPKNCFLINVIFKMALNEKMLLKDLLYTHR